MDRGQANRFKYLITEVPILQKLVHRNSAIQWTGFYMIRAPVVKEVTRSLHYLINLVAMSEQFKNTYSQISECHWLCSI